eukprot:1666015-Alexandrium_andersonii.AAC.1
MKTSSWGTRFEALRRVLRMMHTCSKCEKVYPVGTDECFECALSMERQGAILRILLRNPAAEALMQI